MPYDIVPAELFALGMARRESRIWHKEQRKTASLSLFFHHRRSSEIEDFRGKRGAVR
jgi:hypothetical protein